MSNEANLSFVFGKMVPISLKNLRMFICYGLLIIIAVKIVLNLMNLGFTHNIHLLRLQKAKYI